VTSSSIRWGALVVVLLAVGGGLWWWSSDDPEPSAVRPEPARRATGPAAAPPAPAASPTPDAGQVARDGPAPRPGHRRPVTSIPTPEEVDEAFREFDELSLQPTMPPSAGAEFDREVSGLLNEKTLALRRFSLVVRAAEIGGVLDDDEAKERVAEARLQMAVAMDEIPPPSYLSDPDEIEDYRARMAERALAVLDEAADPNDPYPRPETP